MGIVDRIRGAFKPKTRVIRVREAAGKQEAEDYAFRHLSGDSGLHDLPEMFVRQILRDSHWMYESHGLAERILERVISIILEGGVEYSLTFLPSFEERYPQYAKVIRKRLEEFWWSKDFDVQSRINEALHELLLSGEHGWRVRVHESNGTVRVGDFTRFEVRSIEVDDFDARQLVTVTLAEEPGTEDTVLQVINLERDPTSCAYGHLAGDCIYLRLRTRSSKRRGRPLLQGVIDELKSEKRFRVLSTDRSVARMSSFLDVEVKGATDDELDVIRAKYGTALPQNGTIFYHNEDLQAQFKSANLESYELANMYRTGITIIAGFLGMPISWFGYGDGSTKATSETQQDPATLDYKSMREQFLGSVEELLYFVVDQAIVSRYVTGGTDALTVEVEDESGEKVSMPIRDCITITVSTKPLSEEKPTATPLGATDAAFRILASEALYSQSAGQPVFTDENRLALINHALSKDGTGIEVVYKEDDAPVPVGGEA